MGSRPIDQTEDVSTDGYSMVIDVRSPAEFAIDHLPGAVNLPVLNDHERAEVGTIYVQESTFRARKIGAALISRNIASMLEGPLKDLDGAFHPLIYCWRGGQRSTSLATVLSHVGWRTTLLVGGYRTYRRRVVKDLEVLPQQFRFVCLSGFTGSGKTRLLSHLSENGFQVLNLEAMAEHRGSLLGRVPGVEQPSQKQFESRLWQALTSFDPSRPVWLESESYKIGNRSCPTGVWQQIKAATRVRVEAPMAARVELLVKEYDHFIRDPDQLRARLAPLKKLHGAEKLDDWFALIAQRAWPDFVQDLLKVHYDPTYRRSLKRHGGEEQHRVALKAHDGDALDRAAAWCEATFGK